MADLREILSGIREERGTLTPAVVVEEATDPTHPLHHRFEWDDSIAGPKWRLHQAGELLRVKFREQTDGGTREIRAFWPVHAEDLDGAQAPNADYRPINEVLMDPIARQVMLNSMARDATAFRHRYEFMGEYGDMIRSMLPEAEAG